MEPSIFPGSGNLVSAKAETPTLLLGHPELQLPGQSPLEAPLFGHASLGLGFCHPAASPQRSQNASEYLQSASASHRAPVPATERDRSISMNRDVMWGFSRTLSRESCPSEGI